MTSFAPPAGESERLTPAAPPRTGGRAILVALARGLGSGVLLGAAYRAFMRLISTQPEFSWSGTLLIVGSVTVVAIMASLAATVRARSGSRRARAAMRGVAVLAFVLVLQGPGFVTAPTFVLGGLALGRTTWPRWLRRALALLALASLAVLPVLSWEELLQLGPARAGAAFLVYVMVMGALVRLFAVPTGSAAGRWAAWPGTAPAEPDVG